MLNNLRSFFGHKRPAATVTDARSRLAAAKWPAVVYAIGDIHGCLDELKALEAMIAADAADLGDGERWLVTLGDYVDRGPYSAQVISHLMTAPAPGFRRIALAGNHEQLLLDFLADPAANAHWLEFGGLDTARSYGAPERAGASGRVARAVATDLTKLMPETHLAFLRALPISLTLKGYRFVHAGLRPGVPFERQSDEDLLWIREPFLQQAVANEQVTVHGHTPVSQPEVRAWRIGIDTGAFATGRLTAVRLQLGCPPRFLTTGVPS